MHFGDEHRLFAARLAGDRPEGEDEGAAGVGLLDGREAAGAEGANFEGRGGGGSGGEERGCGEREEREEAAGRGHSGMRVTVREAACVFQNT